MGPSPSLLPGDLGVGIATLGLCSVPASEELGQRGGCPPGMSPRGLVRFEAHTRPQEILPLSREPWSALEQGSVVEQLNLPGVWS